MKRQSFLHGVPTRTQCDIKTIDPLRNLKASDQTHLPRHIRRPEVLQSPFRVTDFVEEPKDFSIGLDL